MALDAISNYMEGWREQRERARENFVHAGLERTRKYIDEARTHWIRLTLDIAFSSPAAATYRGAQDALATFEARAETAR